MKKTQAGKASLALGAFAITVSLLASGGFASVQDAFVVKDPDAWGLDEHFTAYDVVPMDPVTMAEQLETGEVVLVLYGLQPYHLVVEPVPWNPHADLVPLDGPDAGKVQEVEFKTVAYHGQVKGVEDSHALVIVTEAGVAGHVLTEDGRIEFEPVRFVNPEAPVGISVTYRAEALIMPEGEINHPHLTPLYAPDEDLEEPMMIADHEPGPNRVMTIWADKEMSDNSDWNSKTTTAWNTLNDRFSATIGYSFSLINGVYYYCSTTSCNDAWGMSSSDAGTLLREWGNAINGWSTISGFEVGHLLTGKSLTLSGNAISGAAWQPGRYAVSEGYPHSQGYLNNLVGHETGHNFAGDHSGSANCPSAGSGTGNQGRAECYDHWHGWWHKHFTLMWSGSKPGEWVYAPSDANRQYIRNCNNYDWSGGSYSSGSTSGFGWWCTN